MVFRVHCIYYFSYLVHIPLNICILVIVHLKCLSEKGLAKNSDIWQTHLLMVSPYHFQNIN